VNSLIYTLKQNLKQSIRNRLRNIRLVLYFSSSTNIAQFMDIKFNKNEDHNKLLVSDLRSRFAKVSLGGGEKKIEKHHSKGKMTARERIDFL